MQKLAAIIFAIGVLLTANDGLSQEVRTDEEIETIVREYLLREPEVIYEALQVLQARQQQAENERRRDKLVELEDQIFDNPNDPVVGNPDGDVTLVEFFDYQCGYCRRMAPAMQALLDEDHNLRVVMKELPVLGPDSMLAARAATAILQLAPEKYQDFHFALMSARDLTEATLLDEAAGLGVDPDALKVRMASDEVAQTIQANLQTAGALGINGTPSFIIGDRIIPGAVPLEQLTRFIDEERTAGRASEG